MRSGLDDSRCAGVRLSPAQIHHFEEAGYVIAGRVLDAAGTLALGREIERIVAGLPPGHRPENLRDPHEQSRLFLDLCLHGAIVDCAEQLLGPDLLMWGTYGFAKPADGLPVDWHQDGRYFPLTPMETVTAWLAVDDADRENGCLRVVPGSHARREIRSHRHDPRWGRSTALPLGIDIDPDDTVALEMPAGHCSFHDPYLIHGSAPNRSARRRYGIQILYMTRRVHLDTADRQSMGLDWHTLKLFHCRPSGRPTYHYADRPAEIHSL
jgi:ectoine hydroxylase-related dioxygenase (phytanoyl-CoA dioxygenase family)